MQPNPAPVAILRHFSEHRFGLVVLICMLMLAAMLAIVGSMVGFTPVWATHTAPASLCSFSPGRPFGMALAAPVRAQTGS